MDVASTNCDNFVSNVLSDENVTTKPLALATAKSTNSFSFRSEPQEKEKNRRRFAAEQVY